MERSTTLRRFGPESGSLPDLEHWRDHLVEHIQWIADHRAHFPIYERIMRFYRKELIAVSARIVDQRREAADHDPVMVAGQDGMTAHEGDGSAASEVCAPAQQKTARENDLTKLKISAGERAATIATGTGAAMTQAEPEPATA